MTVFSQPSSVRWFSLEPYKQGKKSAIRKQRFHNSQDTRSPGLPLRTNGGAEGASPLPRASYQRLPTTSLILPQGGAQPGLRLLRLPGPLLGVLSGHNPLLCRRKDPASSPQSLVVSQTQSWAWKDLPSRGVSVGTPLSVRSPQMQRQLGMAFFAVCHHPSRQG